MDADVIVIEMDTTEVKKEKKPELAAEVEIVIEKTPKPKQAEKLREAKIDIVVEDKPKKET